MIDYFNTRELIKSFFIINELKFSIHVRDANGSIVNWDTRFGKLPKKRLSSPRVTIASLQLLERQLIHLRENKNSTEIKVSIFEYTDKYGFWGKFENTLTNYIDYFDIKYERKQQSK